MIESTRRDFLIQGGAVAAGLALAANASAHVGGHAASQPTADKISLMHSLFHGASNEKGEYVLPELGYAYDALEPVIDAKTMEIHHSKHHAGYVGGLNAAVSALEEMRKSGDFSLIDHWSERLAFNGGGHFLHTLFWESMKPNATEEEAKTNLKGALAEAITRDFGSYEAFKAHFSAAAKGVQGSGWGLLAVQISTGKLQIFQAQNQHLNTQFGMIPLLGIDVWEHAYYLNYQNNRGTYVDNWYSVLDWRAIGERYDKILYALNA
ncbi:MAG: superoxide dismutase [Sumerlaeia bacterium]